MVVYRRLAGVLTKASGVLLATTAVALPAIANTISGTVIDASGVRPMQGAEVRIAPLGRNAQVDGSGRFRFTEVPAGQYSVTVSFAGAEPQTQDVTVVDGGTRQIAFALSPTGTDMDMILVVGQQSTLLSSIARQRAADTVVTVLTRDSIGQFPDQNVAESLRRAPGINVLNDQGEGRFVSVRGLDPSLNSASINGNRVLATGGDERTVALDVIPNELVESIEIKKSLTPDMDGDTIGGSLDITTTSAFDRKTGFFGVTGEGAYNELGKKWSPKFGVNFSQPITENFGIAGGASWNRRRFATDNVEVNDWNETDDGLVYAEEVDYRDYDVQRVRWGGNLSLDWRPMPGTEVYLRGLYSKFDDTESRRRLIFALDGEPTSGSGTTAQFNSGDGEIEVIRDLKDRREVQSIATVSAGGKTETGPWTLRYDFAWSYASQQENGSVDPIEFVQGFEDQDAIDVTFDYSDFKLPRYMVNRGNAAFLDASRYEFNQLERTTREDATDREYSFRTDIARNFGLGGGDLEVKVGGKARLRTKEQRFLIDVFDGFDGDFTLADVLGRQSYTLANIEPIPGINPVRDFIATNGYGAFERNAFDSDFATAAENYRAREDIFAGYAQARYDSSTLRIIGGVRVERTEIAIEGNRLDVFEEGTIVNGEEVEEDFFTTTRVATRRSYTDFLPSLNVRANVADQLVARAGVFRSLSRPGYGQQAPRFVIEENSDRERSGEFGNPDLQPLKAWNFDATLEYYFAPKAVVQGGFFYKSLRNFIVNAEFNDGVFQGIPYDEAVIPINGEKADVLGFEFSYSHAFTGLPAPFDGLLTNINYTFTDAKGDVLGRRVPLPASSKHTFNVVLGYEKGPVSFRAAGSYRDEYLDELGSDDETDRYVKSLFQIDLSAKYRIAKGIQLFAEVVNLNNAKYTAFQRGPGSNRLLQFEEYRRTFKGGVRATF